VGTSWEHCGNIVGTLWEHCGNIVGTDEGSLACPERNGSDNQLTQQIYQSSVISKSKKCEQIRICGLLVMLLMTGKGLDSE